MGELDALYTLIMQRVPPEVLPFTLLILLLRHELAEIVYSPQISDNPKRKYWNGLNTDMFGCHSRVALRRRHAVIT